MPTSPGREGKRWSVIFQSGRHDGFSPCDVDFFLDVTGEVCQELTRYTFENVLRLADDFGRGHFAPELDMEGHRSIFERWFLIKPNNEEEPS